MNEVIQAMLTRRSVRAFKPDVPVPQELMDQIIQAGTYAANGHGHQAAIIVEITNKALRDRLSELNRQIGGWKEGFDPFYGAPAVLLVMAEQDWATRVYDGSLVMGNLMLAAHALGVGSCWINRAKETFEMEEGKRILVDLGIPGAYEGIGYCALGYPAKEPGPAAPRKKNFVYYAR